MKPRCLPDDERSNEDGDARDRNEVGRRVLPLAGEVSEEVDGDAGEETAGDEDEDRDEGAVTEA